MKSNKGFGGGIIQKANLVNVNKSTEKDILFHKGENRLKVGVKNIFPVLCSYYISIKHLKFSLNFFENDSNKSIFQARQMSNGSSNKTPNRCQCRDNDQI